MPIGINFNPSAANSAGNLSSSNSLSQASMQRMSSGNRITKAADDVAGLAVGTQLQSNVTVLKAAANNVQQANAMLAVADGALENVGDMLQRMNSLAAQATSGSLNDTSRAFLNQEYTAVMDEITRISENTKFNGRDLLDGSFGSASSFANGATLSIETESVANESNVNLKVVQSGDNQTVVLDMSVNGSSLDFASGGGDLGEFQGLRIVQGTGADANGASTSTWEAQIGGKLYIADVSDALDGTAVTFTEHDPVGAAAQTFTMTNNTGNNLALNNQVDAGRLANAINKAFKGDVGFQVGADGDDRINFNIGNVSAGALGIGTTRIDSVGSVTKSEHLDGGGNHVATVAGSGAAEAIDRIGKAIESVLEMRANVGAANSRFDKAFNTINTSAQNQDAARGVYLDADIAEESSKLASEQVKTNASISMLAQANQQGQSLLKLIG